MTIENKVLKRYRYDVSLTPVSIAHTMEATEKSPCRIISIMTTFEKLRLVCGLAFEGFLPYGAFETKG